MDDMAGKIDEKYNTNKAEINQLVLYQSYFQRLWLDPAGQLKLEGPAIKPQSLGQGVGQLTYCQLDNRAQNG